MESFKKNKGITLIALIISIIILLILAVVSISAVTGDGIIPKAKQARASYEQAQAEEQTTMSTYLAKINEATTVFGSITAKNYGDSIEYNDPAGVNDWKVFYKDDNYLYIITSNYLKNTNLPEGLTMSTYDGEPYSAYWASTDNFKSTGALDITSKVAGKYMLSWWKDNSTSTTVNARATADLLNVNAWTAKFGDSKKGIEAIGGPTLEMWIASWNAKGYTKLYTTYDDIGYYIGTTENPSTYTCSFQDSHIDELYTPDKYGSRYLSLASPKGQYFNHGCLFVTPTGAFNAWPATYESSCLSVRPLVAIPASLVAKTEDRWIVVQ